MTQDYLPFSSRDYDKLDRAVFPTVRRRDKFGEVGDVVEVRVGERGERETLGDAEIIAKEEVTLRELLGPFLLFDTQSSKMEEAVESLNSFYQNRIDPDEELTLYWSRWINNNAIHRL